MARKVKFPLRIFHPLIFHAVEPEVPLHFNDFQQAAKDIEIAEFGFGKGKFIIEQAQKNRKKKFFGIEAAPTIFFSTLKKAFKLKLGNLYLALGDARLTIAMYIPKSSLRNICFLFPDPWPKKKHFNRRMISSQTAPSKTQRHIAPSSPCISM